MSNHFKWVFLLGLVMLMLVGCGNAADVETAAVAEPATAASAAISSTDQMTNATATLTAVSATLTAEPATVTAVPPTDAPPLADEPTREATVVLAAQPQLLEFYTEW